MGPHQLLQIILQIDRGCQGWVVVQAGALVRAQREDDGLRQAAEGQVPPIQGPVLLLQHRDHVPGGLQADPGQLEHRLLTALPPEGG